MIQWPIALYSLEGSCGTSVLKGRQPFLVSEASLYKIQAVTDHGRALLYSPAVGGWESPIRLLKAPSGHLLLPLFGQSQSQLEADAVKIGGRVGPLDAPVATPLADPDSAHALAAAPVVASSSTSSLVASPKEPAAVLPTRRTARVSTQGIIKEFRKLVGRSRPTPELLSGELDQAVHLSESLSHRQPDAVGCCCFHGLVNWKPKIYRYPSQHVFAAASKHSRTSSLSRFVACITIQGNLEVWKDWHVIEPNHHKNRIPLEHSDTIAVMLTLSSCTCTPLVELASVFELFYRSPTYS